MFCVSGAVHHEIELLAAVGSEQRVRLLQNSTRRLFSSKSRFGSTLLLPISLPESVSQSFPVLVMKGSAKLRIICVSRAFLRKTLHDCSFLVFIFKDVGQVTESSIFSKADSFISCCYIKSREEHIAKTKNRTRYEVSDCTDSFFGFKLNRRA